MGKGETQGVTKPTLIDRYLLGELLPPFLLNLVFFTFVFLMARILEIANLVVNYRIDLGSVALLLVYAMPRFLEFVVPMSVMMAVLLALLRLSGDNEISALKAGGIGVWRLLPPVMAFALAGTLLTAFMTLYAGPWGRSGFKDLVRRAAAADLSMALKARTFNDRFDGVVLYVSRIDPRQRDLVDVFIEDRRNAPLVVAVTAPRGRLLAEGPTGGYRLRLFDGTVHRVDVSRRTADTIRFDRYDIALDLKAAASPVAPRGEAEMAPGELRAFIARLAPEDPRYLSSRILWHQKFAVPAACLALGFMALPMGIQSHTARRSVGLGLGLASFVVYYLLLSAGKVFGESGDCPPAVGMWLPNGVSVGFGLWLLLRCIRERPVRLLPGGRPGRKGSNRL